jgi:hypothetical protein
LPTNKEELMAQRFCWLFGEEILDWFFGVGAMHKCFQQQWDNLFQSRISDSRRFHGPSFKFKVPRDRPEN